MLPTKKLIPAMILVAATLVVVPAAAQEGTLFIENDRVGIGVADPGPAVLHLRTSASPASFQVETADTTVPSTWYFQANAVTGAFLISNFFGGKAQFQVFPNQPPSTLVVRGGKVGIGTQSPNATLHVEGDIRQRTTLIHPDYIFSDDYELESIDQHAEEMWTRGHLPAVGAGTYDEDGVAYIDHAERSQGMLEELEKAHIYIHQLHRQIEELQQRMAALEAETEAAPSP